MIEPCRLAIDFDGTIVENAYPAIGKLLPHADTVINALYNKGFTILINSCRSGKYEGEAEQFLLDNDIQFHYFNCNNPIDVIRYGMDCRKISADYYFDDKNYPPFPGWRVICKDFLGCKPEDL